MAETRLHQALLLHALPAFPDTALARVLRHYGGLQAAFDSHCPDWGALGVSREAIQAFRAARGSARGAVLDFAHQHTPPLVAQGAAVLALGEPSYPTLLANIVDPPPLLYCLGDAGLLSAPQLAVVGSRTATSHSRRLTRSLVGNLVEAGLAITSGLALGIDGEAHRGALAAQGRTIAVMATGVERVYPARHRALARDILERGGCLVSEFAPGEDPLPYRFPQRNRVVSGLALGTLVMEARLPSGSLLTAASAAMQGREVMTVPHAVGEPGGRGCHQLLRDGAALIESAADVLDVLSETWLGRQHLAADAGTVQRPGPEDAEQRQLLTLLGAAATPLDDLVQDSGLTVARVLAALGALEVAGTVCRLPGGYARRE